MAQKKTRTKPWLGRKLVAAIFGGIPFGLIILLRWPFCLIEKYLQTFWLTKWVPLLITQIHLNFLPLWLQLLGVKVIEVGDDPFPCEMDNTLVISNHESTVDSPLLEAISTTRYCKPAFVVGDAGQWYVQPLRTRGNFVLKKGSKDIADRLAEYMRTDFFNNFDWLVFYPEGGLKINQKEKSDQYAIKNNLPVFKHVSTPRVNGFRTIINAVGETLEHRESNLDSGRLIKWVLDLTLVYNKGAFQFSDMIRETVTEDASLAIVSRIYPVHKIPREEKAMEQWLLDRFQEKDNIIEHFHKTGSLPYIEGNHTPFPPRPLMYGTIWFSIALAAYSYLLYMVFLAPIISYLY